MDNDNTVASNEIHDSEENAKDMEDGKATKNSEIILEKEKVISQLEQSLSESQALLSGKEKELEEVMTQRDEAEKRLNQVDEEAAEKSSRISSLKEELKLLTQDNLTLEEQVATDKKAIESEKQELEEKCTFLHFTQEQLHTQVQTLQDQVSLLTSEMEALKCQLKTTSQELESEKLKLSEVTDTYVKENMDTENEFKRLTNESEELRSTIDNLRAQNLDMHQKSCELENNLSAVKLELEEALKNGTDLTSQINSLKVDIEVLTNDKEAITEELVRVEKEKNGVAFDLATTSQEKASMEETLAGLKTEKEVVLNEIETLLKEKEEIEKLFSSNQEELTKTQEQLSSLFDSSDELRKIATDQKSSLEKKEKEVQDLMGEVQELEMKNSSLEGSLNYAQNEIANLESENKTLLVSFESVEDSLRTYIHRCEDLNLEIQELTSCKEDLNQTCIILESRMLEAEKTVEEDKKVIEQLTSDIKIKDAEIEKYTTQTTELEAKVMDLQELVGLLEKRNQTAQEFHDEILASRNIELDEINQGKLDLEARLKQLLIDFDNVSVERTQLVEMNEELSGQVSDNLYTIKSLQEREQELNGRIDTVCKELEAAKCGMKSELENHWAAEDELLQMHAEMEQTNVQLQEATHKIANLMSQVGNINDQKQELENRYDTLFSNNKITLEELDNVRDEIKSKSKKIECLEEQSKQIEYLTSKISSIKQEGNCTRLELAQKNGEVTSLNSMLEEKKRVIKDYESKIKELGYELKGSEIFISRFKEMESLLEEYMSEVKELEEKDALNKKEIKVKNDLIVNLRNELDPLQEETETYKEKYEALCRLVEPFKEQLESFEMEKAALQERNKEAEGEVKKLATQYGQLLGHQNHKQKIQHLVKLKQENVDMREEMSRMRMELDKYKRLALKSSESSLKIQNKENSLLLSSSKMSTMGAGRTPAAFRNKPKVAFDDCSAKKLFSSTPFNQKNRRQTIASPLSNLNSQHSPRL